MDDVTRMQPADWNAEVDWRSGTLRARSAGPVRIPWRPPPRPGALPKRPLTFFECLDGGFRLLRFAPGATFGVALIVVTIVTLAVSLGLAALAVGSLGFLGRTLDNPEAGMGLNVIAQTATLAGTLASLSMGQLLSGFTAIAGDSAFGSERMRLGTVWRHLYGVRWRLVGLTTLCMVAHVGALVLLMAPGALIALAAPSAGVVLATLGFLAWVPLTAAGFARFALAGSAVAVERAGVLASLSRSWQLTRGSFWKTLGQLFLAYFISSQVVSLIMSPIMMILMVGLLFLMVVAGLGGGLTTALLVAAAVGLGVLVLALTATASALLFAYLCGTASCVYLDRCMRREGYDLVLLRRAETAEEEPV